MKKTLIPILLAGAASMAWAQTVLQPVNVRVTDKGIRVAQSAEKLIDASFSGKETNLKATSYDNRLKIEYTKLFGQPCLRFMHDSAKNKKWDTAWQILFDPVNVTNGKEYELLLSVSSTLPSSDGFAPHGQNYHNSIRFYDAANKCLKTVPLIYGANTWGFTTTRFTGTIPEKAVKAVVSVGCDGPDFKYKDYIAFSKAVFSIRKHGADFAKEGSFVSQPFFTEGEFKWCACSLPGTSVKFKISTAPDVNGKPGKWSDFAGPDGKKDSFYTKSFTLPGKGKNWVRYQAFLTPGGWFLKPSPCLYSVQVGSEKDTGWKGIWISKAPEVVTVTESPLVNPAEPVLFRIDSDNGIDWSSLAVTQNGESVNNRVVRKGNVLTVNPAGSFKKGITKFQISVKDYAGNAMKALRYVFVGPKVKSGYVTVRDDGVTLIDGKPFFPIGLYAVCKRPFNHNSYDEAFKGLKEGGFNMAHTYSTRRNKDFDEFLAASEKYGIRLFISGPGNGNNPDLDLVLKTLEKERLHPMLTAWYIGDDTSGHNFPAQLVERTMAIKAIAPQVITTQADGIGKRGSSKFRGFAFGTDNFLPEIYPVRKPEDPSTGNCVAQVVEDMMIWKEDIAATGAKNRSAWSIIQYFLGWSSWKRFPTYTELRSMSWASVIHGATGVTWYTYGGFNKNRGCTDTPETWSNICRVAHELKDLSHVLTLRSPKQIPLPEVVSGPKTDYFKNPSVTCLLKEENGTKWLFAVNSAAQPVKARFAVGGWLAKIGIGGVKKGKVLYENRNVTLKRGVLEDEFAPQTVHIYELK